MASPGPLALAGMALGGPKINRETTEKLSRNHRGIEVQFFYFSKIWFEAHFWRDLGPSGGPGTGILGQIFIEKLSRNHRGIEVPFFFLGFRDGLASPGPLALGRMGREGRAGREGRERLCGGRVWSKVGWPGVFVGGFCVPLAFWFWVLLF